MRRPNLLLITVDSLRADHLSCLGYSKGVSPNIDQLAAEGTLFTQAIANGPRSPASFPSILASIYQSAGAERGIPRGATTLAEVLKKYGYVTAGYCAGNPYISRYFGYHRGFDLFNDFLPDESGVRKSRDSKAELTPFKRRVRRIIGNSGLSDPAFLLFSGTLRGKKNVADTTRSENVHPFEGGQKLNEHATAWLSRSLDGPFFVWLHYMDVHFPHLPRVPRHPLSDYGRFTLALICLLLRLYSFPRQVMVDLYDDRIKDEDEIVGWLLNWLNENGLCENTVIVLTADHGEEFREHGGWGHAAKLYDELLRVPLIMQGPGLAEGAVVTRQVGLIDLAPTVLNLLGIEERVESFQGTSFLPWLRANQGELTNRYVFSEAVHLGGRWPPLWGQDSRGKKLYRIRSCRTEDWKHIWDEEENQKELYHLLLDPDETRNLTDREPELTRQFESIMADHFSEIESAKLVASSTVETTLSPQEKEEILRRLHDLGYF